MNLHIYDGISPSGVDVKGLSEFLRKQMPALAVDIREDFLKYQLAGRGDDNGQAPVLAKRMALARIHQPDRKVSAREVLPGEVNFEEKFLTSGAGKPSGMLYDGYQLSIIYSKLISLEETNTENCHIVLTNQMFGTWDVNDLRYHARASLYGFPNFLSTKGLIEAPAKPREFYLGRQMGRIELEDESNGRYLIHDDPRMQDALNGYLLQALFYHVTGDPFCDDKECRLFNAHWQEDLIRAQTGPGADLCARHRRILEELQLK